MPHTARLSKRFYEQLGEDVAGELVEWFNTVDTTYQLQLRELNDRNFALFDAKVEQRFAQQDARFEARFREQDGRIDARLREQDDRIAAHMKEQATLIATHAKAQDELMATRFKEQDELITTRFKVQEALIATRFKEQDALSLTRFTQQDDRNARRFADHDASLAGLGTRVTAIEEHVVALREEMRTEFKKVHIEIHALKAELLKWTFLFWSGTALAGLLLRWPNA